MKYLSLEKKIGTKFRDRKLLDTVFIHRSYVNETHNRNVTHNERLEFLGDAVLELVVTEFLYKNYDHPEGELTNWRSALVRGENLAKIASDLELGKYLYLSKGEEKSGGRHKNYLLANTLEALIGAIYLDRNYNSAKKFITSFVIKYLEPIIAAKLHVDAKSLFQEIAQEKLTITPKYNLISEIGPDHQKIFRMGAFLEEKLIATGEGNSKQKAELQAAENALKALHWNN